MVRLVFRPYTQIWRSICTSEPLRASTRVSSGFTLFRHSSPSFGSQQARSCSNPAAHVTVTQPTAPKHRTTRHHHAADTTIGRCRAHPLNTQEISSHHRQQENLSSFTFIPLSYRFPSHRTTRAHVRLLGPCFKTGRTGFPHKLTSHTSITSSTQPWKHPHALNPPSYEVRSKHEVVTTARQTHLLQWI